MTALSQARIPAAFRRSAAQFGVAESDFLVLTSLGIHSYESFALRIHAKENLEEFLRDTICPQAGYNDPEDGLITFNRTPHVEWQTFKMSDDAASLRKLWYLSKELCKSELEKLASGEDSSRVKVGLPSAVAMETSAVDRGMPVPVSDAERPSLFALTRLARSLVGPGASFEYVALESYLTLEEERRMERGWHPPEIKGRGRSHQRQPPCHEGKGYTGSSWWSSEWHGDAAQEDGHQSEVHGNARGGQVLYLQDAPWQVHRSDPGRGPRGHEASDNTGGAALWQGASSGSSPLASRGSGHTGWRHQTPPLEQPDRTLAAFGSGCTIFAGSGRGEEVHWPEEGQNSQPRSRERTLPFAEEETGKTLRPRRRRSSLSAWSARRGMNLFASSRRAFAGSRGTKRELVNKRSSRRRRRTAQRRLRNREWAVHRDRRIFRWKGPVQQLPSSRSFKSCRASQRKVSQYRVMEPWDLLRGQCVFKHRGKLDSESRDWALGPQLLDFFSG